MPVLPIGDPPQEAPISEGAGKLNFQWSRFFLALQLFANRILLFLYAGTAGQVLTANGVGVNPSFQALPTVTPAAGATRCAAYNDTTQSIATSTNVAVLYNSEEFDVGPCHSTSINPERFTALVDGTYLFQSMTTFATSAVGERIAAVRLNGTTFLTGMFALVSVPSATNVEILTTPVAFVAMVAGDYLETVAFQSSGGALNIGFASVGLLSNHAIFTRLT